MGQLSEQIEKLGAYWATAEDRADTSTALKETVRAQYDATVGIAATVSTLHATTDLIREEFRGLMLKQNRDANHIFPPSKHKPDPFDEYVEPVPEITQQVAAPAAAPAAGGFGAAPATSSLGGFGASTSSLGGFGASTLSSLGGLGASTASSIGGFGASLGAATPAAATTSGFGGAFGASLGVSTPAAATSGFGSGFGASLGAATPAASTGFGGGFGALSTPAASTGFGGGFGTPAAPAPKKPTSTSSSQRKGRRPR
jgi:hypothetical protein